MVFLGAREGMEGEETKRTGIMTEILKEFKKSKKITMLVDWQWVEIFKTQRFSEILKTHLEKYNCKASPTQIG